MRAQLFELLEANEKSRPLARAIDLGLIALITINILSVILESVDSIAQSYGAVFYYIELVSVLIFSVEYLARVWISVDIEKYKHRKYPRLAYICSPIALIDLIAILPFYLTIFFAMDLRFLRVLRLLRIFKLTRYSSAMSMLLNVLREESSAFFAGFFILFVLLILTASGAYLVEQEAQPEKFGSIPAAMWWAVATLTTVGYGDVTPVTMAGKMFGTLVTIIGIGMAALPAGILASGLADQLRRNRERMAAEFRSALEDGNIDEDEEAEIEALRKEVGLSPLAVEDIRAALQEEKNVPEKHYCPHCGEKI